MSRFADDVDERTGDDLNNVRLVETSREFLVAFAKAGALLKGRRR